MPTAINGDYLEAAKKDMDPNLTDEEKEAILMDEADKTSRLLDSGWDLEDGIWTHPDYPEETFDKEGAWQLAYPDVDQNALDQL